MTVYNPSIIKLRYAQSSWISARLSIRSHMLFYLSAINLNPHIIKWIQSYLSGREQYVVFNGTQSLTLLVSGVPQGSVLGPLLFLIYINNITCVISNGKISVYTDDIILYQIVHSPMDYIYSAARCTLHLCLGWPKPSAHQHLEMLLTVLKKTYSNLLHPRLAMTLFCTMLI